MKRFLLVFIIFNLIINSFCSQISVSDPNKDYEKIGSVSMGSVFLMNCEYSKKTERYIFRFRNYKYTHITDLKSFSLNEQSKNELYELIKTELPKKLTKELEIKLQSKFKLNLKFRKGRVQFWLYKDGNWSYSMSFNMKKINTIFGKALNFH